MRRVEGHSPPSVKIYRYPLYAFVRRRGDSPHDAQDLTQGFFLHLLERQGAQRYSHVELEPLRKAITVLPRLSEEDEG